ncbi:MAG: HlyC/CorC family transporter [Acidobacteria bacterium]|nr:HlyC/CorC family transporter [Acidobacteriota bacterium]
MVLALAVVLLLILLNALYVAAEFAAVGARRSRLRRLAEGGNKLAARVLPVVEDPRALDRYIAVSQVGITVSSLVLGAFGQAALAPRLSPLLIAWGGMEPVAAQSTAAVTLLLVLTGFQMVLGELVPKSIALQYPTQTALYTVIPMQWSMRMLRWATDLLNGSGILLMRALGVPATGHRHVHSPEEIELLIAESRDGGLLEPVEQVRLHRALRLSLRTARELMVPRAKLSTIEAATPFEDILQAAASSPYTRLPVYRGSLDRIVGILHTRDVVERYVRPGPQPALRSLLRQFVEVPDTMAADKVLAFLRERRSHQAIVRDEAGQVAGLITLEDVLTELLGTVSDEFKTTAARSEPRAGEGGGR